MKAKEAKKKYDNNELTIQGTADFIEHCVKHLPPALDNLHVALDLLCCVCTEPKRKCDKCATKEAHELLEKASNVECI